MDILRIFLRIFHRMNIIYCADVGEMAAQIYC